MKVAKTRRSTKLARKLGFYRHDNGVRSRIYSLTLCRDPWWQWGHRLMILTGTNEGGNWYEGGNWSEPEPPTWWYRRSETKRMWRTGYGFRTWRPIFWTGVWVFIMSAVAVGVRLAEVLP